MNQVILKIRNIFDELSESNQRIATYILENPDTTIRDTSAELGDKTLTSASSVVRFTKKLGYEGFSDFKLNLAQGDPVINEDAIYPIIDQGDSVGEIVNKMHKMINHSTNDLFYQLDSDQISDAISLMKAAKTIYIVGSGASALPASDLAHKLNRLNLHVLFYQDPNTTIELLHYMNKSDVLIAFSYSGLTKDIIYAAEVANQKGAHVISITNKNANPLSEIAQIAITIPTSEGLLRVGAVTSKFNSMIVADILHLGLIKDDFSSVGEEQVNINRITQQFKKGGKNE